MKVSSNVIWSVFTDVFPNADISIADGEYFVPSFSLTEKLQYQHQRFLEREAGITEWHEEIFDCDKWARSLAAWTIINNMVTQIQNKDRDLGALPVAVIYYEVGGEGGGGHAINAVVTSDNNQFSVYCIEPQPQPPENINKSKGGFVNLTQAEKESVWSVVV
jgi:hypothetical protein